MFDLAAAGYSDPVLVAATDGVGTKLRVAIAAGRHHGVGIDLVAMCVNDVVVQGAAPLFFLDYFATARLDAALAATVVAGIAAGCRIAGCALIGGETAEMPGMYAEHDYDLAGFAVGAAERGRLITGADIGAGDTVLGLASNGLHANGFSLVRHVVESVALGYGDDAPFANTTLGEALLAPTRIYAKSCLAAHQAGLVRGLAHITGGGLIDNIPRILPDGLSARLDFQAWRRPPVFDWLAGAGGVTAPEMLRTFNCGIGMAVVVAADAADAAAAVLAEAGESVSVIGRIEATAGDGARVVVDGADAAWRA